MPVSTLEEVLWHVKQMKHEETRRESEDYIEFIAFKDSFKDLKRLFDSYFGPALKLPGKDVSEEAARYANRYGGITQEQTLYFTEREDQPNLAMIWPWRDGQRATVKIVQGCGEEPV